MKQQFINISYALATVEEYKKITGVTPYEAYSTPYQMINRDKKGVFEIGDSNSASEPDSMTAVSTALKAGIGNLGRDVNGVQILIAPFKQHPESEHTSYIYTPVYSFADMVSNLAIANQREDNKVVDN